MIQTTGERTKSKQKCTVPVTNLCGGFTRLVKQSDCYSGSWVSERIREPLGLNYIPASN